MDIDKMFFDFKMLLIYFSIVFMEVFKGYPQACMDFMFIRMEWFMTSAKQQEDITIHSIKVMEQLALRHPSEQVKHLLNLIKFFQARHIGDLGNIETRSSRKTTISFHDNIALLQGPYSILGRTIVIHEGIYHSLLCTLHVFLQINSLSTCIQYQCIELVAKQSPC